MMCVLVQLDLEWFIKLRSIYIYVSHIISCKWKLYYKVAHPMRRKGKIESCRPTEDNKEDFIKFD